jgi:hypothetical protein
MSNILNGWMPLTFGPKELKAIRALKQAIDRGPYRTAGLKDTAHGVYMEHPVNFFDGEDYSVEYAWASAVLIFLKNNNIVLCSAEDVPESSSEEK